MCFPCPAYLAAVLLAAVRVRPAPGTDQGLIDNKHRGLEPQNHGGAGSCWLGANPRAGCSCSGAVAFSQS